LYGQRVYDIYEKMVLFAAVDPPQPRVDPGPAPPPPDGATISRPPESGPGTKQIGRSVRGNTGSMTGHEHRLPLPAPPEVRHDGPELLPLIAPPGREPARTMALLARQPDLLSPFLTWAAALALQGVLPHRDHELLALRVASNCASNFEWHEHVVYAREA